MEAHDYEEAIRLWTVALTKNPALVLVRVNLAEALIQEGRKPEAEATLKKALEFNPASVSARNLLQQLQPR
jgi:tetratricopeptide (TPR) repeat protein